MVSTGSTGSTDYDSALRAFAAEIGPDEPVCVRGGATRWRLGGEPAAGAREVRAPVGVVAFEPAEMTVRVRAGTTVSELHRELASAGQRTALPERDGGTVGGALMAGESSIARLGRGPVREALLQARYVCADGRIASGGAGTVKNVSGFDLCRLLVGSLGTLGLLGEALLRTFPAPEIERWVHLSGADPGVAKACRTAASVLWDGSDVWALLSGYEPDVDEDLSRLSGCSDAAGPPELPPHRWICTPAEAAGFVEHAASVGADFDGRDASAGRFVAEIGVGVVHASTPQPQRTVAPGVEELNRRFKQRFDPSGRLNPGRDPLRKN